MTKSRGWHTLVIMMALCCLPSLGCGSVSNSYILYSSMRLNWVDGRGQMDSASDEFWVFRAVEIRLPPFGHSNDLFDWRVELRNPLVGQHYVLPSENGRCMAFDNYDWVPDTSISGSVDVLELGKSKAVLRLQLKTTGGASIVGQFEFAPEPTEVSKPQK